MIPLTKKEEKMHNKQKVCYICKKRFSTDDGNGMHSTELHSIKITLK